MAGMVSVWFNQKMGVFCSCSMMGQGLGNYLIEPGAMSFANAKACQGALVIQPFPMWLARVGQPKEYSPLLT